MFWKRKPKGKARSKRRKRDYPRTVRLDNAGADADAMPAGFELEEIEMPGVVGEPVHFKDTRRQQRMVVRARMGPLFRAASFAFGLWVLMVASSLATRGLWSPDETRFVALAWDLFSRDAWLQPRLNGAGLAAEPPLALWLVAAGWRLLGISDWWPRVMPALFSLINMVLVVMLARRFWPGQREVLYAAPVILVATGFWALFQGVASAEMVVVALVMTAFLFLHRMAYRARLAWVGFAIVVGLGLLTAGVRFAVYVLPPALLAPVWASDSDIPIRKYLAQMFVATVGALALSAPWWWPLLRFGEGVLPAISLGWATPLGLFEQHRGWWWYLYLIPLVLLPWSIWPLPWLRLWLSRGKSTDNGIAFAMTFGLPVVLALSLISPRQPQLLLPLLPVYAMTIAWLLFQEDLKRAGDDGVMAGMMLPMIIVGAILAVLPGLPHVDFLPRFLWELSPVIGVAVAAVGIALSFLPQPPMRQRFQFLAVVMMFIVVGANLAAGREFDARYRYDQLAPALQDAEQKGWQLVQVDPYQGEYHFAARLTRPVVQLGATEVPSWVARHPDGMFIVYSDGWQPAVVPGGQAVFETTLGDRIVRLWTAATVTR